MQEEMILGEVALRKESVDRNDVIRPAIDVFLAVALRKESVDRNTSIDNLTQGVFKSLSARRAWIEIPHTSHDFHAPKVALRKESVDRNAPTGCNMAVSQPSLSARRAWIEILYRAGCTLSNRSLSARRAWIEIAKRSTFKKSPPCRSPQGERG